MIRSFLLFFFCILYTQISCATPPIRIETKHFGHDVIFVFYRDKYQIIDLEYKNNTVTAIVNIPSEFKISNSKQLSEYATNVQYHQNQKITFQVDKELKYHSTINGENPTDTNSISQEAIRIKKYTEKMDSLIS